jgi:hypothetical protein
VNKKESMVRPILNIVGIVMIVGGLTTLITAVVLICDNPILSALIFGAVGVFIGIILLSIARVDKENEEGEES